MLTPPPLCVIPLPSTSHPSGLSLSRGQLEVRGPCNSPGGVWGSTVHLCKTREHPPPVFALPFALGSSGETKLRMWPLKTELRGTLPCDMVSGPYLISLPRKIGHFFHR